MGLGQQSSDGGWPIIGLDESTVVGGQRTKTKGRLLALPMLYQPVVRSCSLERTPPDSQLETRLWSIIVVASGEGHFYVFRGKLIDARSFRSSQLPSPITKKLNTYFLRSEHFRVVVTATRPEPGVGQHRKTAFRCLCAGPLIKARPCSRLTRTRRNQVHCA